MNTYKVLYLSWIKYLLLVCIALIYSSCTTNQYYTYYDGIYEEPVHVPNTVFSEEMNRVNGLSNIDIDETQQYSDIDHNNDINPNANYQDYNNSTINNNSYASIYVDNNIDPYWNNGWNDPFWRPNSRWNFNRWNTYGWNNLHWGNNFYNPYYHWGWNDPFYGYGYGSLYNNWYGYGYNSWYLFGTNPWNWQRNRNNYRTVRSTRNNTYRTNSNTYRQNSSSNTKYYNSNSKTSTNQSYRRSNTQRSSQSQYRTSTPKTNSSSYKSSSSSSSSRSSSSSGSSYRSNSNSSRRR